jgi:DNA-binding CsgD family transcriptional regulator
VPRDENEPALTARQKAVLGMVARGMTNVEIAETLGISRRTAEFHPMMIMEKLRLDSTAALTLYAAARGPRLFRGGRVCTRADDNTF